jgi:hypothetical protein
LIARVLRTPTATHARSRGAARTCWPTRGDAKVDAVTQSFKAGGRDYPRGTWLVRGIAKDALDRAAVEAGIAVDAVSAAPDVATRPIAKPRLALLHTWMSTQTEGW